MAEMFPFTFASSAVLILFNPSCFMKCVLLRVPDMRPSSMPMISLARTLQSSSMDLPLAAPMMPNDTTFAFSKYGIEI